MRLQRSPERGLCLLTSFAMALGIPAKELLEEVGDDWRTLAFSGLPTPYCWRGIHIQEMIPIALNRGYAVTPIELIPQVSPPMPLSPKTGKRYFDVPVYREKTEESNCTFFGQIVTTCSGVLTGVIAPSLSQLIQRGHAVAFERGTIFDPDTEAYLYSAGQCEARNFYANCIWRFDKIEVNT